MNGQPSISNKPNLGNIMLASKMEAVWGRISPPMGIGVFGAYPWSEYPTMSPRRLRRKWESNCDRPPRENWLDRMIFDIFPPLGEAVGNHAEKRKRKIRKHK